MKILVTKSTGLGLAVAVAIGVMPATAAFGAPANVVTKGRVTVYTLPDTVSTASNSVDIANAQAMPLPTVDWTPLGPMEGGLSSGSLGVPGFEPGSQGNGRTSPVRLPEQNVVDGQLPSEDPGIVPQEFGSQNLPYTTMRVDLVGNKESKAAPYRAAGKLYFKDGNSTFVCSGSLIKRGLVVTAAHCVAQFGANRFYTDWQFVPAQWDSRAPYGKWDAASATVLTSYLRGTDPCATAGVVCRNDVAVIRLKPKNGQFPGTRTGWFGYGWNGYGFTPNNLVLVNQLGYPVSHDSGLRMQRTDAQGYVSAADANNTVWGSRQTGGSSGGPELVNLGILPALSVPLGSEAQTNTVIGVTSWGYTSTSVKVQGASPFLSTNIVPLVNTACAGQAACL